MRRPLIIAAILAGFLLICRVFPPFRVVPLERARVAKAEAAFNAADLALKLWEHKLPEVLKRAPNAAEVLAALESNPGSASTNYGRTVGMSDAVFFLAQGTGTVVSVTAAGVEVSLAGSTESGGDPHILLKTGLVFGNAIRDATGLLVAGEFPNSQDFNALATELNRLAEMRVIPELKQGAAAGRRLRFAAAWEAEAEAELERPLKATPLCVEFR